jgi:hypothetical protein
MGQMISEVLDFPHYWDSPGPPLSSDPLCFSSAIIYRSFASGYSTAFSYTELFCFVFNETKQTPLALPLEVGSLPPHGYAACLSVLQVT